MSGLKLSKAKLLQVPKESYIKWKLKTAACSPAVASN